MLRVVLDTNVIISSISLNSKFRPLIDNFINEKYEIAISNEILLEYEEKIEQIFSLKLREIISQIFLFSPNTIFTNPSYKYNLIPHDPDDKNLLIVT